MQNCMWIFTAAFLIITKNKDNPKSLSTGEWINKLWHMHTHKILLSNTHGDMDEFQKHAKRKKSNTKKLYFVGFNLHGVLEKTKFPVIESRSVSILCQEWGKVVKEKESWGNFFRWGTCSTLIVVVLTQCCATEKIHWTLKISKLIILFGEDEINFSYQVSSIITLIPFINIFILYSRSTNNYHRR